MEYYSPSRLTSLLLLMLLSISSMIIEDTIHIVKLICLVTGEIILLHTIFPEKITFFTEHHFRGTIKIKKIDFF